jgi:hypothetical protein
VTPSDPQAGGLMFARRNTNSTFERKLCKYAEALSAISKILKEMFPQQYFSASGTKQFLNQY